jgi:hypothetical protein
MSYLDNNFSYSYNTNIARDFEDIVKALEAKYKYRYRGDPQSYWAVHIENEYWKEIQLFLSKISGAGKALVCYGDGPQSLQMAVSGGYDKVFILEENYHCYTLLKFIERMLQNAGSDMDVNALYKKIMFEFDEDLEVVIGNGFTKFPWASNPKDFEKLKRMFQEGRFAIIFSALDDDESEELAGEIRKSIGTSNVDVYLTNRAYGTFRGDCSPPFNASRGLRAVSNSFNDNIYTRSDKYEFRIVKVRDNAVQMEIRVWTDPL